MDSILDDLKARVAKRLQIGPSLVDASAPMVAGLGLPSIELLELLIEIEEAYPSLDLEDPQTEEIETLKDLAAWLARIDA